MFAFFHLFVPDAALHRILPPRRSCSLSFGEYRGELSKSQSSSTREVLFDIGSPRADLVSSYGRGDGRHISLFLMTLEHVTDDR